MKNSSKSNVEKLVRKADQLMELNGYSEAKVILENVLEKEPENVEAHYLLGEVLSKQNDFSSAINHLNKALSLCPGHPRILHLLGWATFMNGNPDLGREFLLLSLTKLPEVQTYCDLAVLENKQGNFEKAMEYANKAKVIEPENKMVREVIGVITYFRKLRQQLSSEIN